MNFIIDKSKESVNKAIEKAKSPEFQGDVKKEIVHILA